MVERHCTIRNSLAGSHPLVYVFFLPLFPLDLSGRHLLVIMITYLHHTDPVLPHYRAAQWTFARGAAATVDRPFLGWMGRWFLHDVAHYHVVHHVRRSIIKYSFASSDVFSSFRKCPTTIPLPQLSI